MSSRQTRSKSIKPTTSPTSSHPAGISKPKPASKSPRKARQITAPTPYFKEYTLTILVDKTLSPNPSLRAPFPCYSAHLDARRAGHPVTAVNRNDRTISTLREKAATLEAENANLRQWWSANRGRDHVMEDLQERTGKLETRNEAVLKEMEELAERVVKVKEEKEEVEKLSGARIGEMRWAWEAEVQLLREMYGDADRKEKSLGQLGWMEWMSLGFGFGFGVV